MLFTVYIFSSIFVQLRSWDPHVMTISLLSVAACRGSDFLGLGGALHQSQLAPATGKRIPKQLGLLEISWNLWENFEEYDGGCFFWDYLCVVGCQVHNHSRFLFRLYQKNVRYLHTLYVTIVHSWQSDSLPQNLVLNRPLLHQLANLVGRLSGTPVKS